MPRSLVLVPVMTCALLAGVAGPAFASSPSKLSIPECVLIQTDTPTAYDPYVDYCRPQP